MSKKTLFILLLILITLGFLVTLLSTQYNFKSPPSIPPSGQTYQVILSENGFSPSEITINSGDSIKFTTTLTDPFWPASDLHPTHGIYPEFDPQEPIDPETSWVFKFLKTGKWKYHDHLQPILRGSISVK